MDTPADLYVRLVLTADVSLKALLVSNDKTGLTCMRCPFESASERT
jgi:hypothetical protein